MRWLRSSLLAVTMLALATQPVAAYTMSDIEWSLAYRVRVARGDKLPLRQWLIDLAGRRSAQIVTDFRHRDLFRLGIPRHCGWGEILAWTTIDGRRESTLWAIRAWLASSSHRSVLLGRWDAFGTGATRRNGNWYFAVVFVDC